MGKYKNIKDILKNSTFKEITDNIHNFILADATKDDGINGFFHYEPIRELADAILETDREIKAQLNAHDQNVANDEIAHLMHAKRAGETILATIYTLYRLINGNKEANMLN